MTYKNDSWWMDKLLPIFLKSEITQPHPDPSNGMAIFLLEKLPKQTLRHS